MPVEIVRRSESADGIHYLVKLGGRQYKVHIRPIPDYNGVVAGYIPTIEPVLPIYGNLARAERAALRAIEGISAVTPAPSGEQVDKLEASNAATD